MILHIHWDTTLISAIARGVEDFYTQEQMKITSVVICVYARVKTSTGDDNLPREGGGCMYLMIWFKSFWFGLSEKALFQVIFGLLGVSIRSFL